MPVGKLQGSNSETPSPWDTLSILVEQIRIYICNYLKTSTESLIKASKENGLKVNTERTKYTRMLMYRHQTAGQNHNMKVDIDAFKTR
jgi:hypothetical protein